MRAGAVPELIDERVGELAEPDNAASMAQAIRRLYERDLDALGTAARASARYNASPGRTRCSMQLANYASVFAGSARAPPSVRRWSSASPGP